jgi:TolB-like protein
MPIFTELKRRNVLRVSAAYIAVSWLLIQVVETLFPVFGLTDAAIRAVVIVLAIGLVPTAVIAWVFELTPEGLVRDAEVDRASSSAKAANKRLDRILMVALAFAVGYFAFDKFMLDPARDQVLAEASRQAGRAEAVQEKKDSGPPVLAVLPFSAVTATEDSEFFAAGVHDDLLTKLAQMQSMLVISRSSVMEYRDAQRNIREIGEALGADAILEGGVQSAGNRIRINAQLVDTNTDEHLWAQTYDRELTATSIFDVQDDIAQAIAQALHGTFTAAAIRSPIPTANMAAYRAYHEAVNIRDSMHGGITSDEYRELLHKAADLDPNFTQAKVLLVGSYSLGAFDRSEPELVAKAEAILEDLRLVAPTSADYMIAQTYYSYYILRDYPLALEIGYQALEMVPSDAYLVGVISWIQRRQGNFAGMLESQKRARKLEPTNPVWTAAIVNNLVLTHQYDAAWQELENMKFDDWGLKERRILLSFREHGDQQRLTEEHLALAEEMDGEDRLFMQWQTYMNARDYEAAAKALDSLPDPGPSRAYNISYKTIDEIITYWFLRDSEKLEKLVAESYAELERVEKPGRRIDLTRGLLAAVTGDVASTREHVGRWARGSAMDDVPEKMSGWNISCQIYGIAGAAKEAADCIREGLEFPSWLMPFLEPKLPFYDGVRDEPVFRELVEELG